MPHWSPLSRLSVTFAQGQASGERILGILDEPRSPARREAGPARPDADDADVAVAARAALVTDFAQHLPDRLATRVGDRGTGLSGGQRQRVGIARALLARALLAGAPIVLLDEPTSGLDAGTELLVIGALRRLIASRTVVMTTHRTALLGMATRTGPAHCDGAHVRRPERGPVPDGRPRRRPRSLHQRPPQAAETGRGAPVAPLGNHVLRNQQPGGWHSEASSALRSIDAMDSSSIA
ncbi:ATP-binding cassette domain-containing protein [Streptomyces sp. NPDC002012]|uniref:ATP-binding cassette domain-containing protein n=1 Tax=Streptomyces sp. NPDC002012 TaxID=3154532 RepID=UPI003328E0AD